MLPIACHLSPFEVNWALSNSTKETVEALFIFLIQ